MNFRKVSALASVAVLAFAACSNTGGGTPSPAASTGGGGGGSRPAASAGGGASGGGLTPRTPAPGGDSSKGTVTIAIELPQQGSEKAASDPIINGIKLAVKLDRGAAGGYKRPTPPTARLRG